MFIHKRFLAATLLAAGALLSSVPASAQSFPNHLLTIIVPFPAGGVTDMIARQIAQQMQISLGKPVIVENRPGAGGQLAANAVKRADADGHTMLVAATEMFSIN